MTSFQPVIALLIVLPILVHCRPSWQNRDQNGQKGLIENEYANNLKSEPLQEKQLLQRLQGKQQITRKRRSPNLGITTLALDYIGNAFGIDGLGSSITPADVLFTLFAARKIIILNQSDLK